MKYVVIQAMVGSLVREIPVIFPNDLSHVDVAKAIILGCKEVQCGVPISAGFINSFELDASTHGHSITLNLDARQEDQELIRMCDYVRFHIKSK